MRILAVLCSIVAASIAGHALAAADAYDDASDPVYADGFQATSNGLGAADNGGFGFGSGWMGSAPLATIGSSTVNGDGDTDLDGDIDVGGKAFELRTTGGGQFINISRLFGGTLDVGDRFSFDFDNDPFIDGQFVTINLISLNKRLFEFGFYGGQAGVDDSTYQITDGLSSPVNTPSPRAYDLPISDEGFHLVFELTGADTYKLEITPRGGQTLTETGTLVTWSPPAGAIDRFRISTLGDGGATRNSYFNSFGVNYVPEPAAALGGGAALLALFAASRRRSWRGARRTRRI